MSREDTEVCPRGQSGLLQAQGRALRAEHPKAVGAQAQGSAAGWPNQAPGVSVPDPPPARLQPLSPGPLPPGLLRAPGGWGWGTVGASAGLGWWGKARLSSFSPSRGRALLAASRRPRASLLPMRSAPLSLQRLALVFQCFRGEGLGGPLALIHEQLSQRQTRESLERVLDVASPRGHAGVWGRQH